MDLPVHPIHKKPEYLRDCCKLINSEWKRSETARLLSLQGSCDFLPVNLILLKEKEVIGHAKLSKMACTDEACFIESVVIKSELRGQGYGTYLMNKVEEYSKNNLHLKYIYLSTKGQEKFYNKLGYTICEPIQLYGAPVKNGTNKFNCFIKGSAPIVRSSSPNSTKTYMIKNLCPKEE